MRTSIATVCLSGTLDQKLVAARDAGFEGVEIFEPDLVAAPGSPETIRSRAEELGLSLDLYQPFRDFEGVGPDLLEQNLRRAAAKFTLMKRLGIETILLCSNVATARSGDEQLAATQLRQLGDLAERFGVRVAYEALAWGRFVDSYEMAARIVRLADHDRIGVCLDSFHILSKGHNPEAIETIPADKIFFVQLADAPLLSMDVLSWSRHHRLFPGEGGFDLGAFMGHLMRTGYDGPISLEIFNDTFRQSDPLATAVAARRSLRWLEDEAAGWLGASAGGRATRMSAVALPAVEPPTAVNYVELRTDATNDMRALLEQLGFRAHGGHRTKSVELWSQGAARIVLGLPESEHLLPTVAGIGLSVRDRDVALRRATELFAPQVHREEGAGDEPLVGVRAPDGSEIFFGAEGDSEPEWVSEFGAPSDEDHALIERVDHINLAQPWQHFDAGVLFFHSVLDLHAQPSMEVAAPVGLVRSQVLRSADGIVRIALNLVPPAAGEDAILPQHIAFAASDVLALARAARDRGFRPLDIPDNYYDDLEARYDIAPALLAELRGLNVMYDRDESGEFLHFYTPPIGTVFLEVVERRHGYDGYGALNAPVRLAAQYQQRRRGEVRSIGVIRDGYLVGLIGEGITVSLTPPMHEAEAAAMGLPYEYRVFDLIELGRPPEDVGSLLAEAKDQGFAAMNITHPCKQLVIDVVDELDADAEHLRAVNLVVFQGERLIGYNTDWMGYRDGLIAGLPGASFERVVQIGCGGAGAATAYALLARGTVRLELSDVDQARAEDLAARMRTYFPTQTVATIGRDDLARSIAHATGVVHATPMGMLHHPGVAFDLDLLSDGAWVSDVVYRPLETELIRRAAERGHPVLDGGRMAVGQAYASLQIITGRSPDRDRMQRHFRALIGAEERSGAGGGSL